MKSSLYELLAMQALGPGASGAAATIAPGSGTASLTLRHSSKRPNVRQLWALLQGAGFFQPILNSQHDTTRNFRFALGAGVPAFQTAWSLEMFANPNETIVPTIGGHATGTVVETACMLIEYEDLGGFSGNYIDESELNRRQSGVLTTVEIELTGAGRGWTGSRAINAATNLLKAGREYAVLGITSDTLVAAVAIEGPATGNYRYGLPGDPAQIERQCQGFLVASALAKRPMIPVLNASDASSTQLSFVQNETNVSPNLTLHLALLEK